MEDELIIRMPTELLKLIIDYIMDKISTVEILMKRMETCDSVSGIEFEIRPTDPELYKPIDDHLTYDDHSEFGGDRYYARSRFLEIEPPLDPFRAIYVTSETGRNYRGGYYSHVVSLSHVPTHASTLWSHPFKHTWQTSDDSCYRCYPERFFPSTSFGRSLRCCPITFVKRSL